MKIGLVTWYTSENYGTCLQAYALSEYIKKMGHECVCWSNMRYYRDIADVIERGIRKVRSKLQKKQENNKKKYKHELEVKAERITLFKENFTWVTPQNSRDFVRLAEECDVIITGSDQIWNPYYLTRTYLLNFVPDSVKKIAYSSSIGVTELPNMKKHVYVKYLQRFDRIAVREDSAQVMLKKLLKRDIELVVDPTLLLTENDWNKLSEKAHMPDLMRNKPYILCYFVGESLNYSDDVSRISQYYNLPIVTVACTDKGLDGSGYIFADAGPNEFVAAIKNASYICTDSFHATMLSIVHGKEFFVFNRFKDNAGKSQNTRLTSITKILGLEDRIILNGITMNDISPINYERVADKLHYFVRHSEQYLAETIGVSRKDEC